MIIDCDSCTVRGAACTDCVVTFLTIPVRPAAGGGPGARDAPAAGAAGVAPATDATGLPGDATGQAGAAVRATTPGMAASPGPTASPGLVDLDDDERAAIDVLALSGLVPPLRMVRAVGRAG